MFLFSNVDLIFILSFAFLFALIILWILTIFIIKKYKSSHKKPIDYASKNVHLEENNNNEEINTTEVVQESNEEIVEKTEDGNEDSIKEDNEVVLENVENNNEDIKNDENVELKDESLNESNVNIEPEAEDINDKESSNNEEDDNESLENNEEPILLNENNDLNIEEQKEDIEESNLEQNNDEIEEETKDSLEDLIKEDDETVSDIVEDNKEISIEEKTEKPEEFVEKKKINAVPVKKGRTYNGKFEIFEAGDGYAYQLKASNGEILVVSEIYSSRDSVIKAIKAVQKNINDGEVKIFADKRGKYKFKLIAKNYKPLAISASYTVYKSAVRASESFKKYAMIADIVDVELDDNESKTATPIEITATEDKMGAKIVIEKFDGEFSWALKASNGEILCQAEGYTSKAGCLYSIDTFKRNIVEGQFRCIKDKNGNYCYKLYTPNNRICAVGESYSSKQSAISAANSVVSFYKNAEIEEIK